MGFGHRHSGELYPGTRAQCLSAVQHVLPSNLIFYQAGFILLPTQEAIGNLGVFIYTMPPSCNAFFAPPCYLSDPHLSGSTEAQTAF